MTDNRLRRRPRAYAGTRVARVEDTRLLTGHGTFVDDIIRPGMLHACFVRSPFARATHQRHRRRRRPSPCPVCAPCSRPTTSTRRSRRPGTPSRARTSPDTPRPPLAEGEVKFVGDPVALVVAESRYIAEDAVELVDVDYEPLPAVADFTQGRRGSDVRRARGLPRQRRGRHGRRAAGRGDVLRRRPTSSRRNVYQQIYAPVPIETRGMVVEWTAVYRGTDASGRPPRRRTNCARSAPDCSAFPRRACASSCATPAAGSARRSCRCARTCASCWPRARCPPR